MIGITYNLSESDIENILFIVSCTKDKIWDFERNVPRFIEARKAYKGTQFLDFLVFLKKIEQTGKTINWIILSGKYGFIDPHQPITYYDIYLGSKNDFPITIETLINHVRQQRWKWNESKEFGNYRLIDFKKVVSLNCDKIYRDYIEGCFNNHEIIHLDKIKDIDYPWNLEIH